MVCTCSPFPVGSKVKQTDLPREADVPISSQRHFLTQQMSSSEGYRIMKTPSLNKGLAFTEREREKFGLKGLVPSATMTLVRAVFATDEMAIFLVWLVLHSDCWSS